MLSGKKVLLGITGSIAAYKSALLVRLLVKEGARVKVLMTPAAKDFITPLTLSTLSKNPVYTDFIAGGSTGEWNNHVELGNWADLMIIAPATANTLGKMAHGICDNFLMAVYLSAKCPVFAAPAMDLDMFKHVATQNNLDKISSFGNRVIQPANGELASGLYGEGRMEEPEKILELIKNYFSENLPLSGKQILITAGPTWEAIDPVRFIGNFSSGKMGFALAEAASDMGADVKLITGPVSLTINRKNVERIDVTSADEMFMATTEYFPGSDVSVMAAAVADYQPVKKEKNKIKKNGKKQTLDLIPTRDILATLGKVKKKKQVLVGFALETNNELENAKAKLKNKNLDFIVLNSLRENGAGFRHDTNKISIIDNHNKITRFELKSKKEVSMDIMNFVVEILNRKKNIAG